MPNDNKEHEGKRTPTVRSKTDQRYWDKRIKRRRRRIRGIKVADPDYSAQISFGGQRQRVKLATANKAEATARAASFYRSLLSGGWEKAYATHEFSKVGKRRIATKTNEDKPGLGQTLGELFAAYRIVASPRASTLAAYKKALRKIYADIGQIDGADRHKTAGAGNRDWKKKVDQLPIEMVTSETLLSWKQLQLGHTDCTLEEKRARAITLNSLLRNARSIFSKKHRAHLGNIVVVPSPLAFDEVRLDSTATPRYRSKIDARAILKAADEQLLEQQSAQYLVLNLALRSGLRRKEIDTLLWKSVDLERKVIHVEANQFYDLKSTDSAGEVDIGDELVTFLRGFRDQHPTGSFVVPSIANRRKRKTHVTHGAADVIPEWTAASSGYRCTKTFDGLTNWLRAQGVEAKRPIHELRKEIGSLIADEHGIYAASRFMRHADIRITAASYLDKKKRIIAPI